MLGGKGCQDALLVPSTPWVRDVVELLIELDRRFGGAIFEASQAARIDMQHLGDQRHVAGSVAEGAPDSYPGGIGQQVVDERRPLKAPLPGHRRRVNSVADRLSIVH